MNPKFYQLPREKQLAIINAAMEVFAKYEYKHASTEKIAAKAGISKGLLFYYFHNKKELYLYLYEYSGELVRSQVLDGEFSGITDFFQLLEYGARKKTALLTQNPYIMDFVLKAYYSSEEDITAPVQAKIQQDTEEIFQRYFLNIDFSRFREGIDPQELLRMLTWMTEGYLCENRRSKKTISLEELMTDFRQWSLLFKKMAYKEQYWDENN